MGHVLYIECLTIFIKQHQYGRGLQKLVPIVNLLTVFDQGSSFIWSTNQKTFMLHLDQLIRKLFQVAVTQKQQEPNFPNYLHEKLQSCDGHPQNFYYYYN
jgi:hypothetical protein